jgi:hypothetical protein
VFATIHSTPLAGGEPAGAIEVAHLDDAGSTTVAFWPDEGSAPTGERVYRLVDRVDGPAAGRTPLFAQVVWVNGAGDPAVADAADHGGRERIDPAIRDVEGLVGVLAFRSADHRIVVVGMATGLETHAEVDERIMSTPLLPDEDPALLPGYDRLELGRVLRADIPQAVRS